MRISVVVPGISCVEVEELILETGGEGEAYFVGDILAFACDAVVRACFYLLSEYGSAITLSDVVVFLADPGFCGCRVEESEQGSCLTSIDLGSKNGVLEVLDSGLGITETAASGLLAVV